MEIYAEYLFAENFLMGVLILYLSRKIGNFKTSKKRLCLGGVLCGFFSFIILAQNMGMILGTLIKIGFSILLAYVSFERAWCKATIIIYVVSAFTGGMTIVLLYATKIRGMTNNAVLYIGDISYMNVILGAIVSYVGIMLLCRIITAKQLMERIFTEVTVEIEGHKVTHRALIDSGNSLKEPLTGRTVAVICQSAAKELQSIENVDFEKRYCVIPYSSIGVKNGILEGFKVDNVYIENRQLGNVVVAIYDTEFQKIEGEESYQMLLSKDFLSTRK